MVAITSKSQGAWFVSLAHFTHSGQTVALPLGKKEAKLWRIVPTCLLWAIWKEKNKIVFEKAAFSLDRLKPCFSNSLSSWTGTYSRLDPSVGCILRFFFTCLWAGKFLFCPYYLLLAFLALYVPCIHSWSIYTVKFIEQKKKTKKNVALWHSIQPDICWLLGV